MCPWDVRSVIASKYQRNLNCMSNDSDILSKTIEESSDSSNSIIPRL